ncbi:MAG: cobalamin biosynthesis protein [Myxococcaceae bacterium]|nr:cobalamin biosynthesis protein [Myxococcaceae bacterium]
MLEQTNHDLMLGLGCERDTPAELLERGIESVLSDHGLSAERVSAIATIDHKRDEVGLLTLSARRGWPLWFYSAEQLRAASRGGSEVVLAHVATPAVAEPAALLLAGAVELLVRKTIYTEEGAGRCMTIAVARRTPTDA